MHRLTIKAQAFVGTQVLYFLNAAITQVAILLLFSRLFGYYNKNIQPVLMGMASVIVSFGVSCVICVLLSCRPFSSASRNCVDVLPFLRVNAALNLIINTMVFVLPIPAIWSMDLTTREKCEALTLMSSGLL